MHNQQIIEFFHLLFLRHLGENVDRKLLVLKGGCNLRFFMKSIRYSEDIDLDVKTVAVETLRKNVRKVLQSPSLLHSLQTKKLRLENITEPKQTGTTQRWKIQLRSEESEIPLPTKIEFSRRNFSDGILYEAIDSEIIHHYRLYPILIQHYSGVTAFSQKIEALCHRQITQARDLFDLNLLLEQGIKPSEAGTMTTMDLAIAIQNAEKIGWHDFQSQVVAYFDNEYSDLYKTAADFEKLKTKVLKILTEIKK